MKNLVFFAALSVAFFSCSGNRQAQSVTSESVFELDNLLTVVDQKLEDTVTVVGYVTHTCKHSGRRCFIVGESQKASLRVEAEGEIGSFSQELVGSKLSITGIVREYRLGQEYIAEMEKSVNQRIVEENGSAETCAAELSNIADMRKWMKDNDKDYYVIYYMDGLSYQVVKE